MDFISRRDGSSLMPTIYDIIGTFGVGIIVVTYILLQVERIRSEHVLYSILNAIGALLILISLYYSFNFPSFIVEFFWLLISLFGVGKYLRRRRER